MSDETIIKENEPVGVIETDITSNEMPIDESITNPSEPAAEVEAEEKPEEKPEEIPSLPEKFKYGEKEYTPAEFEAMVKEQQTRKEEQAKNEYQPREMQVIEEDSKRICSELEADAKLLRKNYLAKAQTPYQLVKDPVTGETVQEMADYTPDQAYEHGLKTGDWTFFHTCLGAESANFELERQKLANDYSPKLSSIKEEKEYVQYLQAKQEDLGKWDAFIESNLKESPGQKHLLDKVKNNFGFNEQGAKDFLQWYEEAKAIDSNSVNNDAVNEAAKQNSMNTTITRQPINSADNIPATWDGIVEKMSSDPVWYNKNYKKISRMNAQGLIK